MAGFILSETCIYTRFAYEENLEFQQNNIKKYYTSLIFEIASKIIYVRQNSTAFTDHSKLEQITPTCL